MKKVVSLFLALVVMLNLFVPTVWAESLISSQSKSDQTDVLSIIKAEVDGWAVTIDWLKKGIHEELNIFNDLPIVKYIDVETDNETQIDANTPITVKFNIKKYLEDWLDGKVEGYIKNEEDREIIEKFVMYGTDVFTDVERITLESILDDIVSEFKGAIMSYAKASIVHLISLNRLSDAEKSFEYILNNGSDEEKIYQNAAEAAQDAILACILSAEAIDENDKASLENEEYVSKYIADKALGLAADLLGYGAAYDVVNFTITATQKALELGTNTQLMHLNELLDDNATDTAYTKAGEDKIKYLNAISNQYLDFGHEIVDDYTVNIVSYNAYGKDFSALKMVNIPEQLCLMPVTKIESRTFDNCQALTGVTIPKTVKTIEGNAFYKCSNLKTVHYNAIDLGTRSYPSYIFYDCANIEAIIFGEEVKTIPDYFVHTSAIKTLVVPESIMGIGGHAFANCESLTGVTIPKTVKTIEGNAFYKCSNLKTVHYNAIDLGTRSYPSYIFYDCANIEAIIFGEEVKTIPDYFVHTSAIKTLTIPVSITEIGGCAFSNCPQLTDVYYGGSETDCEKITIGDHNDALLSAVWHYALDHFFDVTMHSVMDTQDGTGLAFRFELTATDVVMGDGNVIDLANATLNYCGTECKLLGMGAVLANTEIESLCLDAVNGYNVLNVPVVYLQEAKADSCAFAVRVINIPNTQLERTIYARPYCIVEVDGEEVVIYGDVDAASCAGYM